MTTPLIKAALATHFNARVQMDLYFIFEQTYIILIDECLRYAVSVHLQNKTAESLMEAIFYGWIMYFGPMLVIAFDQEGGITSEMVGVMCEKFNITRDLGGSQGHTGASLAERRLAIIKLGAMKTQRGAEAQGLVVRTQDIVTEVTMTTNLMLVYGGVTPAQGLTGVAPRELYDPENKSTVREVNK